jgi:hypothetical protein
MGPFHPGRAARASAPEQAADAPGPDRFSAVVGGLGVLSLVAGVLSAFFVGGLWYLMAGPEPPASDAILGPGFAAAFLLPLIVIASVTAIASGLGARNPTGRNRWAKAGLALGILAPPAGIGVPMLLAVMRA